MIELVFEELARLKGRGKAEAPEGQLQVALVEVDLGVWMGSVLVRECGVTATLTFDFFLDGKKVRVGFWSRLFYMADGKCFLGEFSLT